MSETPQPGDVVTVVLRDVRLLGVAPKHITVELAAERELTIGTDEGHVEVTRSGETEADRIAEVLGYLDRLEVEGGLDPSVPATVREVCGLPPRHWPPQPGDVWDDGGPFGPPLWFAQVVHETRRSHLVMVPMERIPDDERVKTPEEWLAYAHGPRLAHRREGNQ